MLHVLLAGASARTLDRVEQVGPSRGRYLTAYAVNLVLNAGWSWTFFRAKKLLPAVAEVLLLEASTVDLARRSRQVDRSAGVALLPYVAWVTLRYRSDCRTRPPEAAARSMSVREGAAARHRKCAGRRLQP